VSYVGVLPMKNPEYITLVMLDEPKKGFETGGRSASPVVGDFYRDLTQLAALPPDMEEVEAYRALLQKTKRKYDDPWQVYVLSDFRARRGSAGGVSLKPEADAGSVD